MIRRSFFGGLAAGLVALFVGKEAVASPPKVGQLERIIPKWEYQTIGFSALPNDMGHAIIAIQTKLEINGENGWELVSTFEYVANNEVHRGHVLKRAKLD